MPNLESGRNEQNYQDNVKLEFLVQNNAMLESFNVPTTLD
jgi:hypothetical protein